MVFPASAPTAWPVFSRSYSRRKANGERESWDEVVERNLSGLQALGKLTDAEVAMLGYHQRQLTALPSGRWLWVGGTPWSQKPENFSGSYNCTSTAINSVHSIRLMLDLAMMGCGTGAVLSERNVSQLPPICRRLKVTVIGKPGDLPADQRLDATRYSWLSASPPAGTKHHDLIVVGDSRQGWAKACEFLLTSAMVRPYSLDGHEVPDDLEVHVDVRGVRAAGERLNGFGGVANPCELPGLFPRMAKILNGAFGRRLTPLEVCLLIDEGARTVVAGNIRRSAGMRQFDELDVEAAAAKQNLWQQDAAGNWSIDPDRDALRMANHTRVFFHAPSLQEVIDSVRSQYQCGEGAIQYAPEALARANVDLLGRQNKKSVFLDFFKSGQPKRAKEFLGFLSGLPNDEKSTVLDHRMQRFGLNPCGEIIGHDFHCNLAEVHLNLLTPREAPEAFKAAAISVAALLHHRFEEPRYRLSRELDPIVGVSFTGLFDHFAKMFGAPWLQWWQAGRPDTDEGRAFKAVEINCLLSWRMAVENAVREYCERHGLKVPNRCTTVQPAGTKSLLTGASPGWHPPKALRYIRRITFAREDPVAMACMAYGYSVIPGQADKGENGQLLENPFDPGCTEWLVEIPVAVPWADMPGTEGIDPNQFSALAQFDFYMQVQRYYTGHNTSATIELREDEIEPLAAAIHEAIHRDQGYISAALLARMDSLQAFPRMPYEPVDKETFERLQSEVLARRLRDDFLGALREWDAGAQEDAIEGPAGCDSDACLLPVARPGK